MRYARHISLDEIGESGQQKLLDARVLMIGAGGLGCPALQYLTAAGVGTIGIVDGDTVDESNLQRQILFATADIGTKKVDAAKARLEAMNPDVNFHIYPENLTKENALEIIEDYDLVIDGTDNFSTRYLVNDACVKLDKPFIYGAIHKFEGQVSVFNLNDGPTYRCLFPDAPKPGQIPNCAEVGVLGVLPGIIGTYQATEAVKVILKLGKPLSGKLKLINLLNNQESTVNFIRNEEQVIKARSTWDESEYEESCSVPPISLSWEAILQLEEEPAFLDVRQPEEVPKLDQPNVLNIPLNEIPGRLDELDSEKPLVVFCQHGIRSQHAIAFLQENFKNKGLINAEGGMASFRMGVPQNAPTKT